jgi:hypothetical protein
MLPLLAALVLGAVLMPKEADASHGFTGVWTSTDPVDGSFQVMTIGFANNPVVVLVDFDATVACPGGGIAIASGRGAVDGRSLEGTFTVRCLGIGIVNSGVAFEFELESSTWVEEHAPTNGTDWTRLF